jgi:hypothetical protein
VATILTNPPYYCLERFIGRALDCATDKVALLLDNRFVGKPKFSKFYTNGFLRVVYFLQWRLRFGRELYSVCAGHHWAVWDRSFHGAASLEFLPRPRVVSPFTEARK